MASLFDDLKEGLLEALLFAKGEGTAKVTHSEIVEKYLHSHSPSAMKSEPPFDLRRYIAYVDTNHISDPDEIPDEILESFLMK